MDMDEEIESFRTLGHGAVEAAAKHMAELPSAPVRQPMTPAERHSLTDLSLPTKPLAAKELLRLVTEQILPHPMGNGHPRYFAWVNSPPAKAGIVAELLAATLNAGCGGGDHAACYLEWSTNRWIMELVGFPLTGSVGVLCSGGSMASLISLAAARQWAAERDGWNVRRDGLHGAQRRMVAYMSTEGHSSLVKAFELLGLGTDSLRLVPVDTTRRISTTALTAMIADDRAGGLSPFCVIGNAGTVNTGAIDPLAELNRICKSDNLWFHVDGAYGGFATLDKGVAPRLRGIESADSVAVDPHKWLAVPIECGCALVRHPTVLEETFRVTPPYLQPVRPDEDGMQPPFAQYTFQLTRGFRALKVWMTLASAGREKIAAIISRHLVLARLLAERIKSYDDLELLNDPDLSIVCFRHRPGGLAQSPADLDAHNRALLVRMQDDGRVFLSGTVIDQRFALRACILHPDTNEDDIETLVAVVRELGACGSA